MSNGDEKRCPFCAEDMDWTDQQLKPCKCGYERNGDRPVSRIPSEAAGIFHALKDKSRNGAGTKFFSDALCHLMLEIKKIKIRMMAGLAARFKYAVIGGHQHDFSIRGSLFGEL